MKDGIVTLSEMSPMVPKEVQEAVAKERNKILDGTWDVFCGPIRDQNGSIVVPSGDCMSDGDMLNMNFFVEGVVGTIPGS
jgi:basic membrane protein A